MKILVCDDESFVRTVISMALQSAGHQVEVACDGQEALEKIQTHPNSFDVLITDKRMPRLTGIELVEKLRALNIPIKVIMASAFATQSDTDMQERLQLDGVLKKPFTKSELLSCLKEIG